MVVYVNKSNTKFIKVINDSNYAKLVFSDLYKQGIYLIDLNNLNKVNWIDYKAADNLLAAIKQLKSNDRMRLINHIRNLQGLQSSLAASSTAAINLKWLSKLTRDNLKILFKELDNYLDEKYWHSWQIKHKSDINQESLLWIFKPEGLHSNLNKKYDNDLSHDFDGCTLADKFQNLLYGHYVRLMYCDSHGYSNADQASNSWALADFRVPQLKTVDNVSNDVVLDNYMLKNYHMRPAITKVTYKFK